MKTIKQQAFGSITLGACSVKLMKGKHHMGDYHIKVSQGTSCWIEHTFDLAFAEELFNKKCEEALKEHGPLQTIGGSHE